MAIDPVTGRTLWTRTDINSRSHIFGDKENVYVVNLTDDNKPSGTRVLRAYDGVTVKAKDFTGLYTARAGVQGRSILTTTDDADGRPDAPPLRHRQGRGRLEAGFPAGSVAMTSEDPNLTGVVEPSGAVRVFDIEKRKEVMTTKLYDPSALRQAAGGLPRRRRGQLLRRDQRAAGPQRHELGRHAAGVQPNVAQHVRPALGPGQRLRLPRSSGRRGRSSGSTRSRTSR